MKGKKFYIILFGLLLIGIGSVYLYKQQQEARSLNFEGYEISAIEDRVDALYNEEKTDIAKDITEDELEILDKLFIGLSEEDLSKRSRDRITRAQVDFLMAREMYFIEEEVKNLFDEKGLVIESLSLNKIEVVEEEVEVYEIKPVFYNRNIQLINDAKEQVTAIEAATNFVESLYDDEGNIREDLTREEEAEALEQINNIKNKILKQKLMAQMEAVTQVLEEREEALVQELEDEEAEIEQETAETAEEEEREVSPTPNNRRPNQTNEQAIPNRPPTRPSNSTRPSSPTRPSAGGNSDEAASEDLDNDGLEPVTPIEEDTEPVTPETPVEEVIEPVTPEDSDENGTDSSNDNNNREDGNQLPPDER